MNVCSLRKLQISIHHPKGNNPPQRSNSLAVDPNEAYVGQMADMHDRFKNVLRPYENSKFYFPKGSFAFSV